MDPTPFAMIPPDNSLSVGSLSRPPIVVELKSPTACTEFTMYIITIVATAEPGNTNPPPSIAATAGINLGNVNQAAFATPSKLTIPNATATM